MQHSASTRTSLGFLATAFLPALFWTVTPCFAAVPDFPLWKKKASYSIADAQEALNVVASGRALKQTLDDLVSDQKLRFVALRKTGHTAGYYHSGVVYLDTDVPFIALVTTLFHEGTHAVEWNTADGSGEDRWLALQKSRTAEEAAAILLPSEHAAYRAQDQFLRELSAQHPALKEAVEYAVLFKYVFAHPVSEDKFFHLMTADLERGGYSLPEPQVRNFLEVSANKEHTTTTKSLAPSGR